MADRIEVKIEGINSLVAKLDAVSYEVGFKGARFGLRKAANLVRDDAKRRAERLDNPRTPNKIADNIAVSWNGKRYRRSGELHFRVGVREARSSPIRSRYARVTKSSSNPGGDTFYWRFLEFGTEQSKARPFMRPALAQNIEEATSTFSTELVKSIDRALKRQSKVKRD